MSTETITIPVDAEAAEAYRGASAEQRQKIQMLLGLWLKEAISADPAALKELMADVGGKAQARGLTGEELQSILEEE